CVAELPHFQKAAGRYEGSGEAVFLAISLDENRAQVGPFMQRHGLRLVTAFGSELSGLFNITGIPATLIIDRAGVIRFKETGFGGAGETYVERIVWRVDELLKPEPSGR
ncbi:MAG TPA: TlpA disulfide reductase family protein, partial [Blastocatellia bacterium]|nr:TlpA disulfide reductase family protein [Blastocatellia bacterium]